ncbi:dihydrofolate reductase family protein [Georgenia deserti]|uniref:Dihydrofolate reductase family protein n=1 Tax=Georgenia deserti TaxID=2093781 RepID=A0ABW4L9I7_9MICO
MTTLTYYTATSLDGFIADPQDSLDWLLRQPQEGPEDGEAEDDAAARFGYERFIAGIGAIVMGSTTYEWILRHHDDVAAEMGTGWPYAMPAWVMTTRDLEVTDGRDVRLASGDVREVYDAMVAAAGGKNLWLVGGGDLAGQFADAGLLDEVIATVAPVTLGSGRPLLNRRLELELLETAGSGPFLCARYRVDGPLLEDRT